MSPHVFLRACVLCVSTASFPCFGQTVYPEAEPNGTKAEATLVTGMTAGDSIGGYTTGNSTTANDYTSTSADTFRIKTVPLPPGIYRHRLVITTGGTVGHTGTIRGLGVSGPPITIAGGDATMQASTASSFPPRFNQWYGFGRAEEVYWRVSGTSATNASYSATLETTPVTPTVIPGSFQPGSFTITTAGQGHTSDTDLVLYDAHLHPVPDFQNDDAPGGGAQSALQRTLPAGKYYLALGLWNVANSLPSGADDPSYAQNPILDFPNGIVASSALTSSNVSFSITDGIGSTQPVSAFLPSSPFELAWYCFTVGSGGAPVFPGSDFWTTSGSTEKSYSISPIPQHFFGNGSNAYSSSIQLTGAPLSGTGLPQGADTIVKRPSVASLGGCSSTSTIPIEIVALSLVSVSPIFVSFSGGSPSYYDVKVTLSTTTAQQQGSMTLRLEHDLGGTFDSTLPVTPRLVFTRVFGTSGLPTVVMDPGTTEILNGLSTAWSYDDGGLGVVGSAGGFADHDGNAGTPDVAYPASSGFVPGVSYPGSTCGVPGYGPHAEQTKEDSFVARHWPRPPGTQPGYGFGFGNVPGGTCPCGNYGAVGHGCGNSVDLDGALLTAYGVASVNGDTLVLQGSGMPSSSALYFQGTAMLNGGLGTPQGDGLRAVGGSIVRLGTKMNTAGYSQYPGPLDTPISIRGLVPAGGGVTRMYQIWYRNAAVYCTSSTFNFSNAYAIDWLP